MEKNIVVAADGGRIDLYLAALLEDLSRSKLQKLCADGQILVNGKPVKPSYKVLAGDRIDLNYRSANKPTGAVAENLPLDILYEDEELLVVNKPRGMVVHPATGNLSGTLVNALLYHRGSDQLSKLGGPFRPGIVHRLDKDTSGILLIAKTDAMHRSLVNLFKRRAVYREYVALVWGQPKSRSGLIKTPIGRDPYNRQRMAVTQQGKEAITRFELQETFPKASELKVQIETGRSHQIRVHLRYIGNPVIGDVIYAPNRKTLGFTGQALHAHTISFRDPREGKKRVFTAALPADYLALRQDLLQMI